MKLISTFPTKSNQGDNQGEEELKLQQEQFRVFAARLKAQLEAHPAIVEAANAQRGQKTAISRAQSYFKDLAIKQVGRRNYTEEDLYKTDAGRIMSGLGKFASMLSNLETVSTPGATPGSAREDWELFTDKINLLSTGSTYFNQKPMADCLHDLLEGILTYDKMDASAVKLVSELCQVVQNVEQEAELLNYQEEIYATKDKIVKFKEIASDFSSDMGEVVREAAKHNVKLKDLKGQMDDARWDIQLSKERLNVHQRKHAEMQAAHDKAKEEFKQKQGRLEELTQEAQKCRDTKRQHLEGEFGIDAFRKNYKKHEDESKKELVEIKEEMERLTKVLTDDYLNDAKKELHERNLDIQQSYIDDFVAKGHYKKIYPKYRELERYERTMLNIDLRFDKLSRMGVFGLLQAEKNKQELSDSDKFILSEYRELKKDIHTVLEREDKKFLKIVEKAFQDQENPEINTKGTDVVTYMEPIVGSMIKKVYHPKATEAIAEFSIANEAFLKGLKEIEYNKDDYEKRAAYQPLSKKERDKIKDQIEEKRALFDKKQADLYRYCYSYCEGLGIPHGTVYIQFKDLEPKVNEIAAADDSALKNIEGNKEFSDLISDLRELDETVKQNSEETYRKTAKEILDRLEAKKARLIEIGRIENEFGRLHGKYKELGAAQAEILKASKLGDVPNAKHIVDRLDQLARHSNDGYDGHHENTDEFTAMVKAVTDAKEVMSGDKLTKQAGIDAMNEIREKAQDYLKKKHKQIRPIESPMRKARLQFAENLVKYSRETAKQLTESVRELRGVKDIADFVHSNQVISPETTVEQFEQLMGNVSERILGQQRQAEKAQQKHNAEEIQGPGLGAL